MLFETAITHFIMVVAMSAWIFGCNPDMRRSQTPEMCKRVFRTDKIDWDLPKTLSIDDLITVEKCGFARRPGISFYSEIIESKEYPIPSLLTELRSADDDHWRGHVIYLIKAVIERERFHSEIIRDRELITWEVELAFNKTPRESGAYERINSLRDGIELFFLKQDGMKFGG